MTKSGEREELHGYLRRGREAVLWKLDGLGEYDLRRPLTPTGTNLLGLVKHLAGVEIGYFAMAFDRPYPGTPDWLTADGPPNVDLWATADESREEIVALYRGAQEHADATITGLALDTCGRVPWWPAAQGGPTLRRVLVHVIAETHRHAGHADIVRELIDGAAGLRPGHDNLPGADAAWWAEYREGVEQAARAAARR